MIDYLVIFVEGKIDELFMDNLFGRKLLLFGDNYKIISYSNKKRKSVNEYINSFKSIDNSDYIFIFDQDGNNNKVQKVKNTYSNLSLNKMFISIYEIESWIISGISDRIIKKYKIKYNYSNTSCVTKEIFDTMIPSKMDKLEFISSIIDEYDINLAINRNESLKTFYNYLLQKKAS